MKLRSEIPCGLWLSVALSLSSLAAQSAYPLPSSAIVGTQSESSAPLLLPLRCVQAKLADRNTLEATQNLPLSFGVWDMLSIGPTSRFLFVPTEVPTKAGVFRFDVATGDVHVMMQGNGVARTADPSNWSASNDDYSKLDPTLLTTWGTILTAEEQVGGRLFEVMNPYASSGFQVIWQSKIPAVKHEGLGFDANGALYFVDESSSGSIYKFVPATNGDLSSGQSFVLRVDAYFADPAARPAEAWSSSQNTQTTRVGVASWVPMTDAVGNALTVADPFVFVTATGGRDAADELFATPYGRPEDLEVGVLANGNECVYVALTSEHVVLSIELTGSTSAVVRRFVDRTTTNLATGSAIGTELAAPDNLAQDAFGYIYVVEDQEPGDLFKVIDADRDGVAESMGRFASLDVAGAEPSGLIFDPNDPYRCYLTVMNPASGNDAVWSVQTRPYPGVGAAWLELLVAPRLGDSLRAGVAEFVHDTQPGDAITIAVDPASLFVNRPFVVVAEPFVTSFGVVGWLPPAWLDPGRSLVLLSGSLSTLPMSPPYGGNAVTIPVPFGLAGLSVLAQSMAWDPGIGLIWSDGVELTL